MIISAIVISTTLLVLLYGALKTQIPLAAQADKSIWFTPIQKAPTASSLSACLNISLVTSVFERMPNIETFLIFFINSFSLNALFTTSTI